MDIDDHGWTCDSDPLLILDVPGIPWVSSARQYLSLSGSSNAAAAVASPTVTYYHYHPQGTNCSPTTAATTTTTQSTDAAGTRISVYLLMGQTMTGPPTPT